MKHECTSCKQELPKATRASVWYMHDNFTFTPLIGDLDSIIAQARKLGVESSYGMLCDVILLDVNDREIRRVGISAHAKQGFDENDLAAWVWSIRADSEAMMLIAGRTGGS
jgi:hypothetical protein